MQGKVVVPWCPGDSDAACSPHTMQSGRNHGPQPVSVQVCHTLQWGGEPQNACELSIATPSKGLPAAEEERYLACLSILGVWKGCSGVQWPLCNTCQFVVKSSVEFLILLSKNNALLSIFALPGSVKIQHQCQVSNLETNVCVQCHKLPLPGPYSGC